MRSLPLLTAVIAAVAVTSTLPALAQTQPAGPEESNAYHAGGRHDQKAHEASLKAKKSGQKMAEPKVHPGGPRHDEPAHKAALRAQSTDAEAAKK